MPTLAGDYGGQNGAAVPVPGLYVEVLVYEESEWGLRFGFGLVDVLENLEDRTGDDGLIRDDHSGILAGCWFGVGPSPFAT